MKLPEEFLRDSVSELGEAEATELAAVLTGEENVTSIRLNREKGALLCGEETPVPWCRDGYYLKERPQFTFDPLFHAGLYYVQEASSMFLRQVIEQYVSRPVRALDLCAAPGGKSTLALQVLPADSLLVSNEIDRQRSRILAENIVKWGNPNVFVCNNAPKDFAALQHYFDVMITDVPCSGEGMFRKDAQAVSEWSEDNVRKCVQRQRTILEDCWECLKPGGLLVYSTCTFNVHEDEENVHWIAEHFEAESLEVAIDKNWKITENLAGLPEHVYHFFPHRTKGEGFFLAALRKAGGGDYAVESARAGETVIVSKKKKAKALKKERKGAPAFKLPEEMKNWLREPEKYTFCEEKDTIIAVPRNYDDDFNRLAMQLYPLQQGITLAVRKGKQWAPAHSLAMSTGLNPAAFPCYEVDMLMAWSYLKGEALVLPSNVSKGYILITCGNQPLGFVKNIGTRSNNLYPQNWKIRTGHFPNPAEVLSVVRRA